MNRTAASLSVVNSVKSNPAIPESAKLGIIWQELQKNMALEETIGEFVKSGRYAQLPTEAEKLEAEKAVEEAKAAELGIEDPVENTEEADADKSEINEEHTTEDISDDTARDTSIHDSPPQNRGILQERQKTLSEAETTPEALKVKRAKARAAYKENQVQIPEQIMDLKK